MKKVCLLGDGAVGKTSLIRRFVEGFFDEKYLSTLGTVVSRKQLSSPSEEYNLNMQIWDISGQTEFKRIHATGFKGAGGALAVCDVTKKETVKNIKIWIENFLKYTKADTPIVILINKMDLVEDDFDSAVEVNEILEQYDYPIYYTSAKTGFNVENAFKNLGSEMLMKIQSIEQPLWKDSEIDKTCRDPHELLDYVTVRFCNAISDYDRGMEIVRNIVEEEGIDFHSITKKETSTVMRKLVQEVHKLENKEVLFGLQQDFLIAITQCKNDKYPKMIKNT
jgi:small GTP-binding protein